MGPGFSSTQNSFLIFLEESGGSRVGAGVEWLQDQDWDSVFTCFYVPEGAEKKSHFFTPVLGTAFAVNPVQVSVPACRNPVQVSAETPDISGKGGHLSSSHVINVHELFCCWKR